MLTLGLRGQRHLQWAQMQSLSTVARPAIWLASSRTRSRSACGPGSDKEGAKARLATTCLRARPGRDEVLYPRPGWLNYDALIRGAAGTPVPVDLAPGSFDLD